MTNHLDRSTCEWLRDIGLPQKVKCGSWYYSGSEFSEPLIWHFTCGASLTVLKCPTSDDLEDFAIMRLRGIFPEAEPEDLYVETIVFGDGGTGGAAGSMTEEESLGDFDGDTKPEMLVSLIRKLVEKKGVKKWDVTK